jgi:hypothetical protein
MEGIAADCKTEKTKNRSNHFWKASNINIILFKLFLGMALIRWRKRFYANQSANWKERVSYKPYYSFQYSINRPHYL